MIRSSKVTTKYANEQKKENINLLIDEYKLVAQKFVDILWNSYQLSQPIPSLLPKEITDQAQTWLSARMIQCCAKQASGIVRGTRRKYEKRLFILHKLEKENKLKQARKLKHFIKINPISKPKLKNIEIELDERFVKFDFDNQTSFDGWINLTSLGNKLKIQIPIRFHKHFIQVKKQGKQLKGIRLSKTGISISFEIEKPVKDIGKRENDSIGNPNLCLYHGKKISPTTLRYVKNSLDIIDLCSGIEIKKIVEVGGGYGGLCKTLSVLCEFEKYIQVDLPEAIKVQEKYLKFFPEVFSKLEFVPCNELKNIENVDLFISNYALSELNIESKIVYYENVIKNSKIVYITYNSTIDYNLFVDMLKNHGFNFKSEYQDYGYHNNIIIAAKM